MVKENRTHESEPSDESLSEVVSEPSPDRLSEPVAEEMQPRLPFTVVGIGASAGGLEAFTEFLQHCDPNSGMAFVFIQHLSPTHDSLLAELLGRQTAMPVHQIEDGMQVVPNHVYVIRPGFTLTIRSGRLVLGESAANRMNRRPVDDFFKSLAEEQRERAVAVILSGTGSNGTLGCESIKAVGGFCIAEDPQTAMYPSMPRSLVDSNLADAILKPKEMFAAIRGYAGHSYATGEEPSPDVVALREQHALGDIISILRTRKRHDFSVYKKPTIVRRVQRRMGLLQIDRMSDYVRSLRQSPGEVTALSDDLMIHVTGFFRDPEVWESLRQLVIQPLISEKTDDSSIRCWVTACSSGEEAYTIGILILEAAEKAGKRFDIKIFATDTAERSLSQARAGVFPGGIESEITPDRLSRFFEKDAAFYRVKKELRELVVFAPQNVLQDPPFSRLDLCTCRNLLIYIEGETQRRILRMLHFGLRDGGALVLGNSETITGAEDLFEPLDKEHRIYRRIGSTRNTLADFTMPRIPLVLRDGLGNREERPPFAGASVSQLAAKTLLDQYTPAAVAVDRTGQVVYLHGDTSRFLMLPSGEPTRDLLALANETIRSSVRAAIKKAIEDKQFVRHRDGTIGEGSARQRVEITAAPMGGNAGSEFFIISFQLHPDPPLPAHTDGEHVQINEELGRVRDELQSTIEELQSSNEEMKTSNEEVTSINEELQSTNEELETSKEELQSLNEELVTINAQYQGKMEELEQSGNDLTSLLRSTEIAVIFLDVTFHIRRFTPSARELVDLIAADAGRPLKDLAWKFDDATLLADAQRVLEKLVPIERELVAHNGRTYVRRILPYRTADNRIDGVVITFVDATERLTAQTAARTGEAWLSAQRDAFQAAVNGAPLDATLGILTRTAVELAGGEMRCAFYAVDPTGQHLNHIVGMPLSYAECVDGFKVGANSLACGLAVYSKQPVITPDVDKDPLWEPWRWLAQKYDFRAVWSFPIETLAGKVVGTFAIYSRTPREPTQRDLESAAVIAHAAAMIISRHEEVDQRGRAQRDLEKSEVRLKQLLENKNLGMIMLDTSGIITGWNVGAEHITGFGSDEAIGRNIDMIFTPEDREAAAAEREIALATKETSASIERWYVRKDGRRFWGSGILTATRTADTLVGFLKVLQDETPRKEAEDALRSTKEAAELTNRMKDDFLATLSHELRTPLSAILIYAKILRGEATAHPEYAEGLDAIARSAEAQKQLIDDLLDTSRITSGKLRLQIRPTELVSLVQQSIDTVRASAEARGVEITVHLANVGTVSVDPDRLQQVVWNLLTNAVKFTPSGGRVKITMARQDREVMIQVADTGQGIDARFLQHVFEPFRQADASASRAHGGLGLGLAICKRLVEQHGGTINADSEGPGRGAVFTVRLPLPVIRDRAANGKPTSAAGAPQILRQDFDLTGLTVLLVEDETETRSAVTTLLQKAGANVRMAASGQEAIRDFQQSRPDLLVSDIGMPGEDGYSLLRRIRGLEAESKAKPVPAAALTAYARDEDREKALAAGFDRHLSKPVDPAQLLRTLQELISPDGIEN